ncbi:hypothetical protein K505DRAFT_389115 [Melanomma pulvis-pyrius CBS 109.77]|uniref:Uncharacterized protein n=1 Tax=Melanomma pulvis-pyrius CBS 109.77 TaxID=1314802 RepID=A0A6A6X560_9PLEO|nr:hypothetical protein K505DRAFT_389115 [Melanomma pulvis-pyrius CBS 109.77]
MDQSQILPPRRSAMALQPRNALRTPSDTYLELVTRNRRNYGGKMTPVEKIRSIKQTDNSEEFVASNIPQDQNVGQASRPFFPVLSALGLEPKQKYQAQRLFHTSKPAKVSPTTELLKIDDLSDYMEACAKYNNGLKAGWTDEQLFEMIGKIRNRPSKTEEEDVFLI